MGLPPIYLALRHYLTNILHQGVGISASPSKLVPSVIESISLVHRRKTRPSVVKTLPEHRGREDAV